MSKRMNGTSKKGDMYVGGSDAFNSTACSIANLINRPDKWRFDFY